MSEIIGQNVNCETGEIIPVYSTPEYEALIAQMELDKQTQEAEAAAKVKQRAAILEQLGLTQEQFNLLVGN